MVPTISLSVLHSTGLVLLTDGAEFPQRCEVLALAVGWPELRLGIVVDGGRPLIEYLLIERTVTLASGSERSVEVTASAVHKIPVDEVFRSAIDHVARQLARKQGRDPSPVGAAAVRAYGRRSVTDDLLREVAAAVREDRLEMPNRAVRARLHCSARTASRWITAARERFPEEFEVPTTKKEP